MSNRKNKEIVTTASGFTEKKQAMSQWLDKHNIKPMSNLELT